MTKTKMTSKQPVEDVRAKPKRLKPARSVARKARTPQTTLPRINAFASTDPNKRDRSDTKQAQVIAMLRTSAGVTIDAIMRTTGWQQHSVRGFLAGVIRKKLGLDLLSEAGEGGRVYWINDRTASSAINTKTNRVT